MASIFAFKCTCCGDVHEGSPSFAFRAPDHYVGLSEEQQAANKLRDDVCLIERDGTIDRFIRAVLEVPGPPSPQAANCPWPHPRRRPGAARCRTWWRPTRP